MHSQPKRTWIIRKRTVVRLFIHLIWFIVNGKNGNNSMLHYTLDAHIHTYTHSGWMQGIVEILLHSSLMRQELYQLLRKSTTTNSHKLVPKQLKTLVFESHHKSFSVNNVMNIVKKFHINILYTNF